MGDLTSMFGLATHQLYAFFLVFLRVGAAMTFLPVWGENSVPVRVKLALAVTLTSLVAPVASGSIPDPDIWKDGGIVLLAASEVVYGLVLGLFVRLFIVALQVAGAIAAQSTSLSQAFAGASVEPQPAFGNLLVTAGLALMVTMKVHVVMVEYLAHSYQLLEVGSLGRATFLSGWGVDEIQKSFRLAFSLAAPFVVASLIYNIALGAINRAMPQLMVSFVGAPAVTAGGLALLLLASPVMLSAWFEAIKITLVFSQ